MTNEPTAETKNKTTVQNTNDRLLESIGTVYEQANRCKLEPAFFEKVNNELNVISDYFKTTHSQSLFVATAFIMNFKNDPATIKELIRYFDCSPVSILKYNDDLETLSTKGIFTKNKRKSNLIISGTKLEVNEKIKTAILRNEPMPTIEQEGIKDVIQLIEKIHRLVDNKGELTTQELYVSIGELISENLHFPFMERVRSFGLERADTCLFLFLMWKAIAGSRSTIDIELVVEDMIDDCSERLKYINTLLTKENELIKSELVELTEAEHACDAGLRLSHRSEAMLEEFGMKILTSSKSKKNNITEPASITTKELFFNNEEQRQINILRTMLDGEPFKEIQSRLQSKGMPKGVTVLLYGSPGTGKTETVYQLAKSTDREIIKVDISESKSMWFGESEKIIKRIFTDYNSYTKKCERPPILLFNEADAILSKRKEISTSNVAQTENAMQNILLEELEKFEGIFMATTNLEKNLDPAFERRFLFKVKFHKPDFLIKAKIWNSKLPLLSMAECETLSASFDFSGGQIDNIIKKAEIHEVINSIKVDYDKVMEFCSEELLTKTINNRIGFMQSKD